MWVFHLYHRPNAQDLPGCSKRGRLNSGTVPPRNAYRMTFRLSVAADTVPSGEHLLFQINEGHRKTAAM